MSARSRDPSAFHGWRVAVACAFAQAMGVGLISVYGFVATPIVEQFGASDGQVGMGMSISILSMALVAPFLGPLLDRGPIRTIMISGVALMWISLVSLSFATELWQLGVGFALCSVGFALYGPLPVHVILVNWFVMRRGTALAVAGLGYSFGSFLVPPLTAALLAQTSWQNTVAIIASGAALVTAPLLGFFVVRTPEERGQVPDGRTAEHASHDIRASVAEISNADLFRDPNFWLLSLGLGLTFAVPIASLFLVRHMESLGVPTESAALTFVVMGCFGMIGKLTSGSLADRFDEKLVTLCAIAIYFVGWVSMANSTRFESMLISSAPIGFGAGALIPMPAMLIGACFGRAVIGRVSGFQSGLGLPFLLASPPFVGFMRDRTGDYVTAFLALAGVLVVAGLTLSLLKLPAKGAGEPARAASDAADLGTAAAVVDGLKPADGV